jgi:hypothetical protein
MSRLGAHRIDPRIRQGRLSESRERPRNMMAGDLMQVQIGQRIRSRMWIRR